MRSHSLGTCRPASFTFIVFVLALAMPAFAQEGPLPPAPASQPPTPATAALPAPVASAPPPDPAKPVADAASNSKTSPNETPMAPAPKAFLRVPSGTHLPLVLHNAISTKSTRPGDPVYFETLFPVLVDGHVVIPAGSYVSGEVTESKRPGRVKGRGELMIKLNEMILPNGYMVNLNAVPSNAETGGGESTGSEGQIIGDSDKASDVGTIAKTTAAGAGIGGIATRTAKGAGIGAGVGAAVGLMTVLLTRGPEAEMPRGTTVEAVLDRPVLLDAEKVQFTGPGQASTLAGPPNREPVRSKIPF